MQCCFLPKRASRELYQYYVICSIRKSIERTPPEGEIGCEKACGYRERTEKQMGCVKMLQDKVNGCFSQAMTAAPAAGADINR